jgi:hypothetical protein
MEVLDVRLLFLGSDWSISVSVQICDFSLHVGGMPTTKVEVFSTQAHNQFVIPFSYRKSSIPAALFF